MYALDPPHTYGNKKSMMIETVKSKQAGRRLALQYFILINSIVEEV